MEGHPLKGPGLRIEMDVRQVWRCAKCGRVARLSGDVVASRCNCSEEAVWMQLEGQVPRRKFPRPAALTVPDLGEEGMEDSSAETGPKVVDEAASTGGPVGIDPDVIAAVDVPQAPPNAPAV